MNRRVFIIIVALAGIVPANAQLSFTISVEYTGTCRGEAQKMANMWLNQYEPQATGIPTTQDCEKIRKIVNGLSYFTRYGKFSCGFKMKAGPCTGRPMSGPKIGVPNVKGVSEGTSFYSVNGAEEIKNWSEDEAMRRMGLNNTLQLSSPSSFDYIIKGDASFNRALAIDREKFRSLNVDENLNSSYYSEDLDMFEPVWQMEKSSRKLPDNDVFAYRDRMQFEASNKLNEILGELNMSREELTNKVWEWNSILNDFILKVNANYREEKAILEKALALAKYKVEYKAILNLKYIDNTDEDKQATETAFLMVNGKTREQYYKEELEKKEQELLANGISKDDIAIVKAQTEKESIVKDHVSTVENIAEGVGKVNDGFIGNDVVSQIVSGISEGASYGVMINNLITIKSYNIVVDAIAGQLDGLEKRKEKTDDFYNEQKKRIDDISTILKVTSPEEKAKADKMNKNNALNWSIGVGNTLNNIKERSQKDIYDALPDINENEFIGKEHVTTIKCR